MTHEQLVTGKPAGEELATLECEGKRWRIHLTTNEYIGHPLIVTHTDAGSVWIFCHAQAGIGCGLELRALDWELSR